MNYNEINQEIDKAHMQQDKQLDLFNKVLCKVCVCKLTST